MELPIGRDDLFCGHGRLAEECEIKVDRLSKRNTKSGDQPVRSFKLRGPIFLHSGGVGYIKCEVRIGLTELRRRRFVFDRMVPMYNTRSRFENMSFGEHIISETENFDTPPPGRGMLVVAVWPRST
jgi:hypothetical protein